MSVKEIIEAWGGDSMCTEWAGGALISSVNMVTVTVTGKEFLEMQLAGELPTITDLEFCGTAESSCSVLQPRVILARSCCWQILKLFPFPALST